MIICEYRIPMPLTLQEYRIGQRYSTMAASLEQTGGGEGVEFVKNEPYALGQYTKKIYHLKTKVPRFIQLIAPEGSLELLEESWNAYPSIRTVVKNPGYMKDDFYIIIDTFIKEGYKVSRKNVFSLSPEELEERAVVDIDIADNQAVEPQDYKMEEDPCVFKTSQVDPPRGPLKKGWFLHHKPLITVFKLVRANFKWWGLQNRVENAIVTGDARIFRLFHRKVFCWMDRYKGMDLDAILKMEAEAMQELERRRKEKNVRGGRINS